MPHRASIPSLHLCYDGFVPFAQVKDLLKRTAAYHRTVAAYYKKIESHTQKEPVKQITDYLATHERCLSRELQQFAREQDHELSEAWIQADPSYDLERVVGELKIDEDTTVEDIILTGVELNRRLIKYFQRMAEVAPSDALKEMFLNMEKSELEEQKKLASWNQY